MSSTRITPPDPRDASAALRTEVGFAECGDAVDLAEGFAAFWHHDTMSDRSALTEWMRQLYDELGRVLHGIA